jgi:DNA invertase Pin-like site-specific DNA recombinase
MLCHPDNQMRGTFHNSTVLERNRLTLNPQINYVSESQVSIKGVLEMKHGYARVSSKGQDYTAQVEALTAAGCERIFSEKASGKSTDGRPEFAKLLKVLLPGDTVVVTKLDRLARSSRDLHNILHELDGLSAGFVSLRESWCDTTSPAGRLMLTIMGGIAEFERDLIRSRCDEGIDRARKLGKRFGRPERLDDGQKRKIADFYAAGKTIPELAAEYECGVGTIWRALQPRNPHSGVRRGK